MRGGGWKVTGERVGRWREDRGKGKGEWGKRHKDKREAGERWGRMFEGG